MDEWEWVVDEMKVILINESESCRVENMSMDFKSYLHLMIGKLRREEEEELQMDSEEWRVNEFMEKKIRKGRRTLDIQMLLI